MTIDQNGSAGRANLSKNAKLYLLGIAIIGSLIRIALCYDKPFLGDEVGTLIYIKKDIPYLLSHFATWLTMNYFLVAEKLVSGLLGENALGLELIPLSAGIMTIPLTAILATRFTSQRTALAAATLIALNPYLIQYSGIVRAYSLLTVLSLLLLIVFFRWYDLPTFRSGLAVAAVSLALILAHPNGVYSLACPFVILAADAIDPSKRNTSLRRLPSLLFPLALSMVVTMIAYSKIAPEMLHEGATWHGIPPTTVSYIPYIFGQYFSEGFFGWLSALCLLSGIVGAYKYEKPVGLLLPCIVLPILLMSIQGVSYFPWQFARFLIFIVPIIVIFIAEGVEYFATRFFSRHSFRMTLAILLILVFTWLPRGYAVADERTSHPWHRVAAFLKEHVRPGDVILGSSWGDAFHFRPYFSETSDIGPMQLDAGSLGRETLKRASTTVYFVSSRHVRTLHTSTEFGRIQVVRYEPSGGEGAVGIMRKDLISTVRNGEELAPEFASLYKNIWDIDNALGVETARTTFYYYNLWIKCMELSVRQRNIPLSLQRYEAQEFLKSLK